MILSSFCIILTKQ